MTFGDVNWPGGSIAIRGKDNSPMKGLQKIADDQLAGSSHRSLSQFWSCSHAEIMMNGRLDRQHKGRSILADVYHRIMLSSQKTSPVRKPGKRPAPSGRKKKSGRIWEYAFSTNPTSSSAHVRTPGTMCSWIHTEFLFGPRRPLTAKCGDFASAFLQTREKSRLG